MRFASLGSGSRGNATLIEAGGTRLLLDCGFSIRETKRRLARLGCSPGQLTGIVVTHEHSDHVSGVAPLARRYGLPVWMTPGTRRQCESALGDGRAAIADVKLFTAHEPFAVGAIEVVPYPVPHDAREPCQFLFRDGARTLGVLTDAGRSTPHVEAQLSGCDAIVVECNHDPELLRAGSYPPFLKARVGGQLGHLSNGQAAAVLGAIDCSRLQHVVAAHLSQQNNRPDLARAALSAALDCEAEWIAVAEQDLGLQWRDLR